MGNRRLQEVVREQTAQDPNGRPLDFVADRIPLQPGRAMPQIGGLSMGEVAPDIKPRARRDREGLLDLTDAEALALGDEVLLPETELDQETLFHEAAHLVQGGQAPPGGSSLGASRPGDSAEKEADRLAASPDAASLADIEQMPSPQVMGGWLSDGWDWLTDTWENVFGADEEETVSQAETENAPSQSTGEVVVSDDAAGEQVTGSVIEHVDGSTDQVPPDTCVATEADYTVVAGDTLWGIAQRFLGDGNHYMEIAALNGISNPNLIQPGQSLQLPGASDSSVTQDSGAEENQEVVQDGDEGGQDSGLNWLAEQVVDRLGGDWAGKAILRRYLSNGGDWRIVDDPEWTAYMTANSFLSSQVQLKLSDLAERFVADGVGDVKVDESFPAEIENGESVVGYQYLHGTNATVGGFQIVGTARLSSVAEGSRVAMDVDFVWNDIIDPNYQYGTDLLKNFVAEIISLGGATPYTIGIQWGSELQIDVDKAGEAGAIRGGWPAFVK